MKTTFKTIGVVTAMQALSIASHADIQHISTSMMLPELNQFLENLRTESLKNLEPLREKIEKTRCVFTAQTYETFEDFSEDYYKELPADNEQDKKQKKKQKEIFLREHKPIPGEPNKFHGLLSSEADRAAHAARDALWKLPWEQSTVTEIKYNVDNEPISVEALQHPLFFSIERPLLERSEPFH